MIKKTNYVNALAIVILSALTLISVCSRAEESPSTSESDKKELKVLLKYVQQKLTVIVPTGEDINSYDAFYAFWVKSADQCRFNLEDYQKSTEQSPEDDDNLCLLHTRSQLDNDWKKYKVKAMFDGKKERDLGSSESLPPPSPKKPNILPTSQQNLNCVFSTTTESCLVKMK